MYMWNGMTKISKKEAIKRFHEQKNVFLLYPDDTEAEANKLEELLVHDEEFGYENNKGGGVLHEI